MCWDELRKEREAAGWLFVEGRDGERTVWRNGHWLITEFPATLFDLAYAQLGNDNATHQERFCDFQAATQHADLCNLIEECAA